MIMNDTFFITFDEKQYEVHDNDTVKSVIDNIWKRNPKISYIQMTCDNKKLNDDDQIQNGKDYKFLVQTPFVFSGEQNSYLTELDYFSKVFDARDFIAKKFESNGKKVDAARIMFLSDTGEILDDNQELKNYGIINFQVAKSENVTIKFIFENPETAIPQKEESKELDFQSRATFKEISDKVKEEFQINGKIYFKYKEGKIKKSIPNEWANDEYCFHQNSINDNALYVLNGDKSRISFLTGGEKSNIRYFDGSQLKLIGAGGFGQVYRSKVEETNQDCAVKIISYIDTKDNQMQLRREISLLSGCHHPCILPFLGFRYKGLNDESDKYVIITEYEPNKALENILADNSSNWSDEWTPLQQLITIYGIASGMKYLHQEKIIHRDLKPANILFDAHYRPVIADFGLSKKLDTNTTTTSTNAPKGTYAYMAPEAFNGDPTYESDVYSFGVILYEILEGKFAFRHFHSSFDLYNAVCNQNWRPSISDEIPKIFKDMIERCWLPKPSERFAFADIVSALESKEYYASILHDEDDQDTFCAFVFDIKHKVQKFSPVNIDKYSLKAISINLCPWVLYIDLNPECQELVYKAENNRSAQYQVGRSFFLGELSFPHNVDIGLKYLELSSKSQYFLATKFLVNMYIKNNNLSKAHELIKDILYNKNDQNYLSASILQGKIEMAQGNYDMAKLYFEKAIEKRYSEAYEAYAELLRIQNKEANREQIEKFEEIARNEFNDEDSVMLTNLDKNVTEEAVKAVLTKAFGPVIRCSLSGQIAWIKFHTPEQRSLALQRNTISFDGTISKIMKIRTKESPIYLSFIDSSIKIDDIKKVFEKFDVSSIQIRKQSYSLSNATINFLTKQQQMQALELQTVTLQNKIYLITTKSPSEEFIAEIQPLPLTTNEASLRALFNNLAIDRVIIQQVIALIIFQNKEDFEAALSKETIKIFKDICSITKFEVNEEITSSKIYNEIIPKSFQSDVSNSFSDNDQDSNLPSFVCTEKNMKKYDPKTSFYLHFLDPNNRIHQKHIIKAFSDKELTITNLFISSSNQEKCVLLNFKTPAEQRRALQMGSIAIKQQTLQFYPLKWNNPNPNGRDSSLVMEPVPINPVVIKMPSNTLYYTVLNPPIELNSGQIKAAIISFCQQQFKVSKLKVNFFDSNRNCLILTFTSQHDAEIVGNAGGIKILGYVFSPEKEAPAPLKPSRKASVNAENSRRAPLNGNESGSAPLNVESSRRAPLPSKKIISTTSIPENVIYIRQLPNNITTEMLYDSFVATNVRPLHIFIVKNKIIKCKSAYIVFPDNSDLSSALKLHNIVINGQSLPLYLSHLPYNLELYSVSVIVSSDFTKDDLRNIFGEFDVYDIQLRSEGMNQYKAIIYINNKDDYEQILQIGAIPYADGTPGPKISPYPSI